MKKKTIINIIKLLSGGVLTSVCLIIMTSQKWSFLGRTESLSFIKYYQWELLGLTISKLGIDQVNYAFVIENKTKQLDIKYYTIRNSILTLLFCVLSYYVISLSPIFVIILFFTIILDLYSILSLSTFNALSKFNVVLISNLLNYPFFFIILLFISFFSKDISILKISIIFLISSLVRAIYLFFISEETLKFLTKQRTNINPNLLGLQQILNYFLFKADQVLLSLLSTNNTWLSISNEIQMHILFYSRVPEIYSSISTGLSSLYIEQSSLFIMQNRFTKYKYSIGVSIFIFSIFSIIFLHIYTKSLNTTTRFETNIFCYYIAYSIQLLLIIPANIMTFLLLRKNSFKRLNLTLVVSIILTSVIVFFLVLLFNNFGEIIKYIVPMQLFIYTTICLKLLLPFQIDTTK